MSSKAALATLVVIASACAVENPLFGVDGSGTTDGDNGSAGTTGNDGGVVETSADGSSGGGSGGGSGSEASDTGIDGVLFRDDEWPGEFAEGDADALEWAGDHLRLAEPSLHGVFTSRMFDAGETVQWDTFKWRPAAPYGKPLPNDGISETEYMFGNADMTDIHQLLHFDPSDVPAVFVDMSGLGHDAHPIGPPDLEMVEGRFGRALQIQTLDATLDLHVELFEPMERDFTWSFWFRSDGCREDTLISYDSIAGIDGTPGVWMACDTCNQSGKRGISFGARGPADPAFTCAPAPVDDGGWHHVALVKQGHYPGQVTTFFDGTPLGNLEIDFGVGLTSEPDLEFLLGGHPRGSWPGRGEFDELAIWHRALENEEIRSLYERGVVLMRLRARACDQSDCADAEYVGPGADQTRWWTDVPDSTGPPEPFPLDMVGRYAQYQVEFDAERGSPQLQAVELIGQ